MNDDWYRLVQLALPEKGTYRIRHKGIGLTQMYLSGGPDLMEWGIRFLDPDSGDEMELGKWYDTSVREQYHFNPFMNWVNDPNGLCWFKGYYHLFYQSNPFGQEWNDMYWGHAVSRDLVHWTHMPYVLEPQPDLWRDKEHKGGAFSGSAQVMGEQMFYRWFLSMVAHWRGVDRQHGNSTSPLLVGSQGYRKSTFCRIILPPELRFGYTDSIDFKSKQEAERYLGRFFLINIDEFDQINVSQQGFLKHLLQKPVANLRKPYGNTIREMRRYASFIGTSNQKDLLTDPSGSRRFICIEVTAPIQTNVTINYKQLYDQAMEAIYKGERYWLNDEDENILKQTNREFEQASPLEQLFHCYLNPVEEEMEGEWLTAMQILSYLQTKTRDKLAISKVGQFGRALQKLNIPCRKSRKGTLYHLVKVE